MQVKLGYRSYSRNFLKYLKRPSTLPSPIALRRSPKTRFYQENELSSFSENDKITESNKLNNKHSPEGFQFKKHLN